MKKANILYWVFTIILAVLMIMSAIPDVINDPQAITMIHDHLGYPLYFVPFIGVAKLFGAAAILVPGFPRIKEWAYAGFVYDIGGAIFSSIAVGDPFINWAPLLIGIVLIALSYIFYHRRLKLRSSFNAR